jgi:hypothetical protein
VATKKVIRIGMRVRSIYDPTREFIVDRTKQPDKLFHEKGSKRWYSRFELQSVSKHALKLTAKLKTKALAIRSDAFQGMPPGSLPHSPTLYRFTCLFCGTEGTSKRKGTKFCTEKGKCCRTRYWRNRNEIPEVPDRDRLRSEKANGELERETA